MGETLCIASLGTREFALRENAEEVFGPAAVELAQRPRQLGALFLRHADAHGAAAFKDAFEACVDAPIALSCIRALAERLAGEGRRLDWLDLIATDQPPHIPARFRDQDTHSTARVFELLLKDELRDTRCRPWVMTSDPSEIDTVTGFVEQVLLEALDERPAIDEIYVVAQTGTPQMKASLPLVAQHLVTERDDRRIAVRQVRKPRQESPATIDELPRYVREAVILGRIRRQLDHDVRRRDWSHARSTLEAWTGALPGDGGRLRSLLAAGELFEGNAFEDAAALLDPIDRELADSIRSLGGSPQATVRLLAERVGHEVELGRAGAALKLYYQLLQILPDATMERALGRNVCDLGYPAAFDSCPRETWLWQVGKQGIRRPLLRLKEGARTGVAEAISCVCSPELDSRLRRNRKTPPQGLDRPCPHCPLAGSNGLFAGVGTAAEVGRASDNLVRLRNEAGVHGFGRIDDPELTSALQRDVQTKRLRELLPGVEQSADLRDVVTLVLRECLGGPAVSPAPSRLTTAALSELELALPRLLADGRTTETVSLALDRERLRRVTRDRELEDELRRLRVSINVTTGQIRISSRTPAALRQAETLVLRAAG